MGNYETGLVAFVIQYAYVKGKSTCYSAHAEVTCDQLHFAVSGVAAEHRVGTRFPGRGWWLTCEQFLARSGHG